jgi:hypothetical protein
MVAFSRDNLLVFLGQQPNAHFILMDQNQLSPHIEQDSFPLFRHEHDVVLDEFSELIGKVLTNRVKFAREFADELFLETSGHPFLTANILVEFVDWLIEGRRRVSSLSLAGEDFASFRASKLVATRVSISPEYQFFREAIADATSPEGRTQTPWLYAIYTCLRDLSRSSPETFSCTRSDFSSIASSHRLEDLGFTTDMILSTGGQANFFDHDDEKVWPKVRVLGRIAAVTRARVSP